MHAEVQSFIERTVSRYPKHAAGRVLDVGARQFHDQWTPRRLFPNYIGVDLAMGPNVDQTADAHRLPFADAMFDMVLCANLLEHDRDPAASLRECARVLRPGGVFILTVPEPGTGAHDVAEAGGHYADVSLDDIRAWTNGLFSVREFERWSRGTGPGDSAMVGLR